ncbi:hypothetical protein B0T18DRAFT_389690 [Schizothecium vesticola]|uniref:DUF6594 domain-containing protein n=1 Tax=Schizothecium vesticola TaxID=314040 RepID=A0AA40F3A8_9PEZI|nr:hypothetical protein B0T18DRAFT_389690 [Schizothecium vesticola]
MPRASSTPRPRTITESDSSDRVYALRDMFEGHGATHRDQSRGRSASTPRSDRDITMLANRSDWSRQRAAKCQSAIEPPVQAINDEASGERPQSYRATIEDVEEDDDDEEEEEEEDDDDDDEDGDNDEEEEETEGDTIVTPRNRLSTPQHKQEIHGLPSKPDQNKEHAVERRQSSNSRSPRRPDALSFLVEDSPEDEATHDAIQQAVSDTSAEWSPRSAFSSSSGSGSHRSVADTNATTPDHSVNGDDHAPKSETTTSPQADKYGTPEMTRGPARHPHIPPRELQPRIVAPGQGHAKHLPRAEKLPMSGYELLSSKLSHAEIPRSSRRRNSRASSASEPDDLPIQPIYRRFEALNHRLLLHLQDELSELEEQLHRLDTADTQNRRMSNCILPASRRAEFMAGGELQWHKTDVLGKIGYKLGQYNHVLSTFHTSQALPSASLADIETYRTYLATRNPIAEIETRFLDPAQDLVCLARARRSDSLSSVVTSDEMDMLTPMPLKTTFGFDHSPMSSRKHSVVSVVAGIPEHRASHTTPSAVQQQLENLPHLQSGPAQIAVLLAVAIIGPVLFFPLVSDFVGRMALVLVVGVAVGAVRGRMVDLDGGGGRGEGVEGGMRGEGMKSDGMKGEDVLLLAGVYAGVMGVVAALV